MAAVANIASAFAVLMLRKRYIRGQGIQFMGENPFTIRRGYRVHRQQVRQAMKARRPAHAPQ